MIQPHDEPRPILLVDDSAIDLEMIQRAFQKANNSNPIFSVKDGLEAIAYMEGQNAYADRRKYPLPAFMLLDLKLPKKNGFEVLRWLRSRPGLNRLIVAICSGSPREEDVEKAYDLGANMFFVKPTTLEELTVIADTICKLLRSNRFPALTGGLGESVGE